MITAAEWGRSASWGEYRRRKRFALRCRAGHASLDSLMRRIPIFAARSDGTLAPRSHGPRPMPFFCRSPPRFAARPARQQRRARPAASTATRSTSQPFSCAMHLIAPSTLLAASRNGSADRICLLSSPRGIAAASWLGMSKGINGWPASTTQIGSCCRRRRPHRYLCRSRVRTPNCLRQLFVCFISCNCFFV